MSEVTDLVLPILKGIQSDIADLKHDVGGLKLDIGAITERMDSFEDYFIYTMGLTQQNKADIKRMRSEIAAIKARLNGPEGQRYHRDYRMSPGAAVKNIGVFKDPDREPGDDAGVTSSVRIEPLGAEHRGRFR